jgi:copper chaperone CopZ
MKLYTPDVTCEHGIASIKTAVNSVEGATSVSGDSDSKSFITEVANDSISDQLAVATEAEGYPPVKFLPRSARASPASTVPPIGSPNTPAPPPTGTPASRSTVPRPRNPPRAAAAETASWSTPPKPSRG